MEAPEPGTAGNGSSHPIWELLGILYKPHPWHGLEVGDKAPEKVTCYIEIVPSDTVKYEIEKTSGYLRVDRPQQFSNRCPTLYGFLPQTYCGERVAAYCSEKINRDLLEGDGDPLDICVLSSEPFTHGDFLVDARPIGGLRMIDGDEVDDKIIAVLAGDIVTGKWADIGDCPESYIQRIMHYFLTYKQRPGQLKRECEITGVYGTGEAQEIIRRSMADYQTRFKDIKQMLSASLGI